MKKEVLEIVDIKNDEKKKSVTKEVTQKKEVNKTFAPPKKEVPQETRKAKKTSYIYKITNKTFQSIQLVMNENDMLLLESRKRDNVVFVKHITKQIENLEKKGMIKIRKMN